MAPFDQFTNSQECVNFAIIMGGMSCHLNLKRGGDKDA